MEKNFLDISSIMINSWNEAFEGCDDVYVVNKDLKTFISDHDDVSNRSRNKYYNTWSNIREIHL